MKRFSKKTSYWMLGSLLLAVFGALWLVSPQWSRTGMVVLSGNTPPVLSSATFVSHSNPTQDIEVVIGLNLRDEAALDALLAEQNDPKSPNFRKFITAADFKTRFSPQQADVDKVVAYLKSNGLTIEEITDNRVLIKVKGTAKQFETTFNVAINVYQLHAKVHLSNDRDPSVPRELRGIVNSVVGLSTFAEYHNKMKPSAKPQATTPVGFGATDIAKAYDFPNQSNANAKQRHSGKGVTIGVATVYTYNQSDVDAYWKQYGVKRTGKINDVRINGHSKQLDGETTLDLEQSSSQAPGADIIMYLGNDPSMNTFALMFNRIVTDDKADIVTISWGLCEANTGSAQIASEHVSFKQGAAQGMSFFAAAGDDGAYDCGDPSSMGVDYPSSDPFVTAVGGTALELNADGSRKSESAWSGAGGGTSIEYDRPAWQTTVANGLPQGTKRETSDISLNSDPATGYSMYFHGAWDQAGGTSFAAPATAGMWALGLEAAGGARITPNPTLYRIGASSDYSKLFFDVITGDNGAGVGPGLAAGPGWDHPTGWGTPNASALIEWLVNDKAQPVAPPAQPARKR
jgi:kumamolisin